MASQSFASFQTDRSVSHARVGILAYGIGSYLLGVAALVAVILVSLGASPFTGGPVHIATPVLAALFNVGPSRYCSESSTA